MPFSMLKKAELDLANIANDHISVEITIGCFNLTTGYLILRCRVFGLGLYNKYNSF